MRTGRTSEHAPLAAGGSSIYRRLSYTQINGVYLLYKKKYIQIRKNKSLGICKTCPEHFYSFKSQEHCELDSHFDILRRHWKHAQHSEDLVFTCSLKCILIHSYSSWPAGNIELPHPNTALGWFESFIQYLLSAYDVPGIVTAANCKSVRHAPSCS